MFYKFFYPKFDCNVWVDKKEESDFEEHTFSTIKEITIKFNAKEKDNEVIVKVN